jgi:hypothetical protein
MTGQRCRFLMPRKNRGKNATTWISVSPHSSATTPSTMPFVHDRTGVSSMNGIRNIRNQCRFAALAWISIGPSGRSVGTKARSTRATTDRRTPSVRTYTPAPTAAVTSTQRIETVTAKRSTDATCDATATSRRGTTWRYPA